MPIHPSTNFELKKCQIKPKFNGVYWGNNLPKRMGNIYSKY